MYEKQTFSVVLAWTNMFLTVYTLYTMKALRYLHQNVNIITYILLQPILTFNAWPIKFTYQPAQNALAGLRISFKYFFKTWMHWYKKIKKIKKLIKIDINRL